MNIIPDLHLALLQVVPFLVLVAGLQAILFKPMLDYLHDRAAATVGAKHDAQELVKRAEAQSAEYEARLKKVLAEIAAYRSGLRVDAHKAHAHQVAEARRESDVLLHSAVGAVQRDADAARKAVGAMAHELAGQIATTVLGRPVEA